MKPARGGMPIPVMVLGFLTGIGLLLVDSGCAFPMKTVNLPSAKTGIGEFHEGVTSREEIVQELGEPARTYVEGRVAVWLLDKKYRPRPEDDEKSRYHLVAVIGARGVAERISLLRVR